MKTKPGKAEPKVWATIGIAQKRDFLSLYELLHSYTLREILDFFYNNFSRCQMSIGIINAFVYFEDAEHTEGPNYPKGLTWDIVKTFIQSKVREYLK